MEIICRKCSNTKGFYMQQHGMQIGLYCDTCGSWLKWVGKKEIPTLKNRGVKLFSQNEEVHLKSENLLGVVVTQNTPLATTMGVEGSSFDDEPPFGVSPSKSATESEIEAEIERRVKIKMKELKVAEQLKEKNMDTDAEYCNICDGSSLEVANGVAKVEVSIFSGVLTITDIDGVNILGLYKLKRCPGCGKIFK